MNNLLLYILCLYFFYFSGECNKVVGEHFGLLSELVCLVMMAVSGGLLGGFFELGDSGVQLFHFFGHLRTLDYQFELFGLNSSFLTLGTFNLAFDINAFEPFLPLFSHETDFHFVTFSQITSAL